MNIIRVFFSIDLRVRFPDQSSEEAEGYKEVDRKSSSSLTVNLNDE